MRAPIMIGMIAALGAGAALAQSAEPSPSSFLLYAREPVAGPVAGRMTDIQNGVVAVLVGEGHTTGFFISTDGYLLTSHVPAGAGHRLTVRLPSGRAIAGEVVATHSRRDVALIRTSEGGPALPLARSDLPLGGDVHALGTPFTERPAVATRGAVRGYRSVDGMRYIQSDVGVQKSAGGGPLIDASGNVVGVTVTSIAPRGAAADSSFFVPIDDALSSVGIERVEAVGAPRDRSGSRMVRVDPSPAPPSVSSSVAAAAPAIPAPVRQNFDGDYRTVIAARVFQDLASFPLTVTVQGSTIKGSATARSIGKYDHVCRANGTVGGSGEATLELFCSAMSVDTVKIARMSGQFMIDPSQGNAVTAKMTYRTHEGRTGQLAWAALAAPPPASSGVASAAAVASPAVVTAAVARPSFEGRYRASIAPTVFPEFSRFQMVITVSGSTVSGAANAREIVPRANGFADHICRVDGTINDAGVAAFDLVCSSVGGVRTARMTGQFAADPAAGDAVSARTQFRTNDGRVGQLTWQR